MLIIKLKIDKNKRMALLLYVLMKYNGDKYWHQYQWGTNLSSFTWEFKQTRINMLSKYLNATYNQLFEFYRFFKALNTYSC